MDRGPRTSLAALAPVLCLVPLLLEHSRLSGSKPAYLAWASATVLTAVLTVALLAGVGARFQQGYVDL